MRCVRCHYEQESDFEICPSCATPVKGSGGRPTGSSIPKKKKMSHKRKMKIAKRLSILAAAVIAVIVLISVIFSGDESKFVYPEHSVYAFENELGTLSFMFDGSKVVEFNEDTGYEKYSLSASGKYAVVLTSDGQLYLVNSKKCVKFDDADEVGDFYLAPLADTVLYIKDYDEDEGGTLCYCNLSSPSSSKLVAYNVFYGEDKPFISSPGGKAFAFVSEYDGINWTYSVMLKGSSKAKQKLEDARVDAVSDNGKYVYYFDDSDNFCVNDKIICGDEESTSFINAFYDGNASEALVSFENMNGTPYTALVRGTKVYNGDSDRQKGSLHSMLLPDEIKSGDYYDVDSFVKTVSCLVQKDGNIENNYYYYISSKSGGFKKLIGGEFGNGEIYISSNCTTVYFRKANQGSIKYMSLKRYNDLPKEYDSDADVAHFKMSRNGKHIYFIDNEGTLYYQKNKTESIKICQGVNADNYYVTNSGNVYVETEYNGMTSELLFSKKGGEYIKVRMGSETMEVIYSPSSNALVFETYDGFYRASAGKGKKIYSKE